MPDPSQNMQAGVSQEAPPSGKDRLKSLAVSAFRKIAEFSFLLLPAFSFYLFYFPVSIDISEIGLEADALVLSILFLLFFTVWLNFSGAIIGRRRGDVVELCFHLFPIELFLFLIFAQYHFWICLILLLALIAFAIILYRRSLSKRKEQEPDRAEKRRARLTVRKSVLLLASLVMLVPAILSVVKYDLRERIYYPSDKMLRSITEQEDLSALTDTASFWGSFEQKKWKDLSLEEKITVSQLLVDYECQKIGIPEVPVCAQTQGTLVQASFHTKRWQISVDTRYMKTAKVDEYVKTLLHETWHAEQEYLISQFPWESELADNLYFEELAAWKDNTEHYYSGNDDELYTGQPMEAAANAFAESEWEEICGLIVS